MGESLVSAVRKRTLLVACIAAAAFCTACDRRIFKVPHAAMEPTIPSGSYVQVRMISEEERAALKRGQIVAFEYPRDPEVIYLKRLVAFGGDVVELRGHRLVLSGELVDEPYIQIIDGPLGNFGPIRIKEGQAFMLGDNRGRSADSRVWGTVEISAIIGVVELD